MSFTDDDLKRLKQLMETPCTDLPQVTQIFRDYRELLPSLLARLEAAEKAARWFNCINPHEDSEPFQDYKNWRKSAGK